MEERIKEKICCIEEYLKSLIEILPESLEEYKRSILIKNATERYFEKIVEAVTDLSHLVVKELMKKLIEAKDMRNVLAHQYKTIEDEKVFESSKEELPKDIQEFISDINKALAK
jgi:uncharacterized protein YutE (UPF0331/DUF86 family)